MSNQGCASTLGPGAVLCNSNHCNAFQETSNFHRICNCVDWQGKPIPNCSPKDNLYPVETAQCHNTQTGEDRNITSAECSKLIKTGPWEWQTCYCCCSCYAFDTPIAIPGDKTKVIQDIDKGEKVLAASAIDNKLQWVPKDVGYSSGTGPNSHNPVMIYLDYGDKKSIIVSEQQLFLLPNGKFRRADQLRPETDELVGADGESIKINHMKIGAWNGGIHHIATTIVDYEDFDGSTNGHLLNSNGVVTGDYLLQLYQDLPKMQPHMDDKDASKVGSKQYADENKHLTVKHYAVGKSDVTGIAVSHKDFTPYGETRNYIPPTAAAYLTSVQEADMSTGHERPFSDKTGISSLNYLFKLYKGFYPDIHYHLDWECTRPNAFAFVENGQAMVVISGALVRNEALYAEGLSIIVGFCIASLYGGTPLNANGYSCVGQADYSGLGIIMREVYQGDGWKDVTLKGMEQIRTFFGYLSSGVSGGGKNKCADPSIECRLETMNVSVDGSGNLPTCAGGPVQGGLNVLDADADNLTTVAVDFNVPLSAYSAENPKHYSLDPVAEVTAAKIPPHNDARVLLTTKLKAGTGYKLTVSEVYAHDGSTLNPNESSVKFKAPAK